jgi:uncharacterized repeat protein (TIGR01451 family)
MKTAIAAFIAAFSIFVGGNVAVAATPLELKSDVFVERQVVRGDGSNAIVLEKPNLVTPGDNLVFVVRYKNVGSSTANNFVVTNPLPTAVAFNGTADGLEIVSINGGKSWGILGTLRVTTADGTTRPASLTDVTHIKWNVNQPLTAGAEGKLIFRGIVK